MIHNSKILSFKLTYTLALFLITLVSPGCTKEKDSELSETVPTGVETFPIANSTLKNCRFKVANPSYPVNAQIEPNPIICDEGVARSVQVLGPNTTLPVGLQFSSRELSLVGTPTEKVTNAPYQFYLENEAGYVILKMNITVR